MTGKDIYKVWAPSDVKWVDWVRPVPFISIDDNFSIQEFWDFSISEITYLNDIIDNIGIIVDLPGTTSVQEGIGLAKLGFRPIPIYNGTTEQENSLATTDNHSVQLSLILGTYELQKINLSKNAPPAFLLDSNRTLRYKMRPSVFDNSWDIFYQDLPTAEYFLSNNINKIIVRSEKINKDLKKILYGFQKKGLEIFFTNGFDIPKKVVLNRLVNLYKN